MRGWLLAVSVWGGFSLAPQYAGEWWDGHFNLFQSLTSLVIMVGVLYLTNQRQHWWRAEFATVCVLHILHNLGDYYLDFPAENYGVIQSALNWLELAIILGAGGITELIRICNGRRIDSAGGSGGSGDAQRVATGPRGQGARVAR